MAHVAPYKKKIVEKITKLIIDYPIIGCINMENLPASALQKMRKKLAGKAEITMTKRRLMNLAFAQADKTKNGITSMIDELKGMPALLFTKENPFAIYKTIKQSKTPAPAKAGQLAPHDITVKAGPTSFMPGPVIGELGSFGIKTGVENGKIVLKEDKIVAKEGDTINDKLASLLLRLGIEPMEIGLEVTAIYQAGVIYKKNTLDIDEEAFNRDLDLAANTSFNLALEISYSTKETISTLITKSYKGAKALGIEAGVMSKDIMPDLIAKAQRQGSGLKNAAKI